MKDVAFYYRKKNGLRISDEGLADIFLGGKGISVKVTLNSTTSDEDSIFEVKKVKAKVDTLKFGIHDVSLPLTIDQLEVDYMLSRASIICCIRLFVRSLPTWSRNRSRRQFRMESGRGLSTRTES